MDNQVSHLSVSSSPHIRSSATTTKIMGTVIIALVPALVASAIIFGPRALLVSAVTVAAAVAVVAVTAACAANPAGESLLPSASPLT